MHNRQQLQQTDALTQLHQLQLSLHAHRAATLGDEGTAGAQQSVLASMLLLPHAASATKRPETGQLLFECGGVRGCRWYLVICRLLLCLVAPSDACCWKPPPVLVISRLRLGGVWGSMLGWPTAAAAGLPVGRARPGRACAVALSAEGASRAALGVCWAARKQLAAM